MEPRGKPGTTSPPRKSWRTLVSSAAGLSAQEAAQRLVADGPNELKEGKRIGSLQIFLGQFKSIIIWILVAAGVISGVLGEVVDAIAILAIVVLNALMGLPGVQRGEVHRGAQKTDRASGQGAARRPNRFDSRLGDRDR